MDELYKTLRAFLDANDLPEPAYATLSPETGNLYAAFDAVAEDLPIPVMWEHLSGDRCHAITTYDGAEVALCAKEVAA